MDRSPEQKAKKAYGSIPHLPGSRAGVDRHISHRQAERLTLDAPEGFTVVVQEKLDGSCVAAARIGDEVVALGRAGDRAAESRNAGRRLWAAWVSEQQERFRALLEPGERVVGEWLALAHSTHYDLSLHSQEPFVAFDLMRGKERATSLALRARLRQTDFCLVHEVHRGAALSVDSGLRLLGQGGHGARELPEGLIYRLESQDEVVLVAKHVRAGKVDGCLLEENSGQPPVWNWGPDMSGP